MVMEKVETPHPSVSVHKWASVWHQPFFFALYGKKIFTSGFHFGLRQREVASTL